MKSFNDLKKLSKKIDLKLPKLRLALLGDSSTQLLMIALKGEAVFRGYELNSFESDYNQIEHEFMNPNSKLHEFNPDYIIIFHSTHKLLNKYSKLDSKKRFLLSSERLKVIEKYNQIIDAKIIYLNYPEIDDAIFGSYSNKIENTFLYQLRDLNYKLMNYSVNNSDFYICDVSNIQNKYGRNFLFDPVMYASSDLIFSLDSLPIISSRILDTILSLEGKIKKCLILDLDNTLWGGVIGDDGIENIRLGKENGIGKIYLELQHWIKKIKERGIILAICSKNDEHKAKDPFLNHPEMVLKIQDISVFVANWENKASNIKHIQSILNIDLDSMVFLDDNPVERELIKKHLPEVTVPDLPSDPSLYLEYLYSLNLFETSSFSVTDKNRTRQYQEESKRVNQKKYFESEDDFLKDLDMIASLEKINQFNIPRISQLSLRTNQFNLRTIRYEEKDIKRMKDDKNYKIFAFNLKDKFGDNGLISWIKGPSSCL